MSQLTPRDIIAGGQIPPVTLSGRNSRAQSHTPSDIDKKVEPLSPDRENEKDRRKLWARERAKLVLRVEHEVTARQTLAEQLDRKQQWAEQTQDELARENEGLQARVDFQRSQVADLQAALAARSASLSEAQDMRRALEARVEELVAGAHSSEAILSVLGRHDEIPTRSSRGGSSYGVRRLSNGQPCDCACHRRVCEICGCPPDGTVSPFLDELEAAEDPAYGHGEDAAHRGPRLGDISAERADQVLESAVRAAVLEHAVAELRQTVTDSRVVKAELQEKLTQLQAGRAAEKKRADGAEEAVRAREFEMESLRQNAERHQHRAEQLEVEVSDLHQRVMELEEALEKNIKDHDQVLKDQVVDVMKLDTDLYEGVYNDGNTKETQAGRGSFHPHRGHLSVAEKKEDEFDFFDEPQEETETVEVLPDHINAVERLCKNAVLIVQEQVTKMQEEMEALLNDRLHQAYKKFGNIRANLGTLQAMARASDTAHDPAFGPVPKFWRLVTFPQELVENQEHAKFIGEALDADLELEKKKAAMSFADTTCQEVLGAEDAPEITPREQAGFDQLSGVAQMFVQAPSDVPLSRAQLRHVLRGTLVALYEVAPGYLLTYRGWRPPTPKQEPEKKNIFKQEVVVEEEVAAVEEEEVIPLVQTRGAAGASQAKTGEVAESLGRFGQNWDKFNTQPSINNAPVASVSDDARAARRRNVDGQ